MRKLYDRLIKKVYGQSSFRKSTAQLVLGTGIGQGIAFISLLALTRIYSRSDFGLLAVYVAAITTLSVVVSLRYEQALLIAETEEEAVGLLILCFAIVLCMSVVLAILCPWLGPFAAAKYGWSAYTSATWLLPVGCLCAGVYQALSFWAVRQKRFSDMAIISVHQNLMMVALQIALGLFNVKSLGLVYGQILFRETGSFRLSRTAPNLFSLALLRRRWESAKSSAKRYRNFALVAAPSALLNVLGLMIPTFLFGEFYGSAANGDFGLSQRVAAIPMVLIGNAVSQTYMGEASKILRDDPKKLLALFDRTAKRMLPFSCALALLGLLAPFVFGLVFGKSWSESGIYTAIIVVAFAAQLVVSPVSATPNLVEKQHYQLWMDIVRVVLVTLSMVLPHALNMSARVAISAYSAILVLTYLGSFIIFRLCAKTTQPI